RRNANRLGFAMHLAYLRFPGRVLGSKEHPGGATRDSPAPCQLRAELRPGGGKYARASTLT
ncbi:MAG TPA: hypothetical protein VIT23_09215, partial [Terrimicrobiaceae bacterium]